MTARYDVVGLGNAIVDVIAQSDDSFLIQHGIAKGAMTLIDGHRARLLEEALTDTTVTPGGSAANTIAGLASLGGAGAFIGRVHDDWLGESFAGGTKAIGVDYTTPFAKDGAPTARSVILVSPDGERSMNTYLGASVEIDESDIDEALVGAAKILFIEGYLWDTEPMKGAIRKAIRAARAAGRQVAFTCSDAFCVGRFREEFVAAINAGDFDIIFANESEIISLYEKETFEAALEVVQATGKLFALTRSEKGAVIAKGAEVVSVPATPGVQVVDTTGAGDQFAAGFLYGVARDLGAKRSGELGVLAAGEVISHIGPRPKVSLKDLAAKAGLI